MRSIAVAAVYGMLAACGGTDPPPIVDAGFLADGSRLDPDAPTGADATTTADARLADGVGAECEDGEMRAVECGNCGIGSEICANGIWTPQGACIGQGPCAAGSIEVAPTPLCGEEQRICTSTCEWTDWFETVPGTGECEPGSTQLAQADCPEGSFRHQTCTSSCTWMSDPAPCTDACGGASRVTTFEDEQDVCIPAGPFIRGSTLHADAQPVATVTLSAFYVDKYTVTNRRYKLCYDAGVCPAVMGSLAQANMLDPAYADHPVRTVTRSLAQTFCTWDGGRRFLTEAEWEKAARGPAPSEELFPWGGTSWDCTLISVQGCAGYTPPSTGTVPTEPYTAYPEDVSYYGMRGMITGGHTPMLDWWQADYYSDPSSLVDPPGPATGTLHNQRGHYRHNAGLSSTFAQRNANDSFAYVFIRCGRDAP